jgi:cytochrome bd-type quinol oxidase subunit 2
MTANRARRKTMRKVALYGTIAIVLATVANVLHTVSHAGQHLIYLPMWQLAYVTAVIYFAPVVTVILLWSGFRRAGAWLLLASMAALNMLSRSPADVAVPGLRRGPKVESR